MRLKDKYILLGEYKNIDTKTLFKCLACNYEWNVQPDHLLNSGSGCPICAGKCKTSKGEKIIYSYLKDHNIEFEHHKFYKIDKKNFFIDFVIEPSKIIIEYNGLQHYKPIKYWSQGSIKVAKANLKRQQQRDLFLKTYFTNLGYNVITIPYSFKKEEINKILEDTFHTITSK